SQMYKYQEKHLTLATAMMVKDHLENLGYRVIMTRRRDVFIPLENRAKIANKPRNTLFVSIHYNAAANRKAEGVEVFFYQPNSSGDQERSKASKKLASAVLKDIIKSTHAPSRGIKSGNFHVIRNTNIPSILVEGGFLTNKNEMIKLKDPKYLNRIAWGVAKGIENYLESEA
ncbi:MAG: N-acetylmuramoyl-L-alanine amidase, partial [Chlamydiales bacterium]